MTSGRVDKMWQEQLANLVIENEDEAVARCLALSQRLGDSPDPKVRSQVVDALVACAKELAGRGSDMSALRIVAEIRSRFAGDPVARIQTFVAGSLTLAADLEVRAGDLDAAIATYDDALSLVAGSEEMARRGVDATLLLEKGRVLGNHGHPEEAIVVLDSALMAIRGATARKPALRISQAAEAVTYKLDQLCALDRFADATTMMQQFGDVLSDISGGAADDRVPLASAASEPGLAAALADIVNHGQCWAVFAGSVDISALEAAQRACRLYALSDPWILSGAPEPVEAAAALVRVIADGYALLAGQWSAAERASLPLPVRAELGRHELLHQRGVTEWSRKHGHPLRLTVRENEAVGARQPPTATSGLSNARPVEASLTRSIIKCLYLYELADVLSQSEYGREALRYKLFAAISIEYLRFAMNWGRSANAEGASDGSLAVAVACLQIAEGFFALTHCQSGANAPLSLRKERLRGLLHEAGGYDWLTGLGVSLPVWTHPRDA